MEEYLQQETKTSDLVLASYLRAKGMPLSGTELDGKICVFIFEGEEAEQVIKQWQMNPTPEMKLIRDSHSERENLFKLIKQTVGGQNGSY